MDKIAIVVQRYGKETNGGEQVYARLLAEHLTERYEVVVLTSCFVGYAAEDNHYPAGEEIIDGIRILRFTYERGEPKTPRWLGRYIRGNYKYYNTGYTLSNIITLLFRRIRYRKRKDHDRIFERWLENENPLCKEMISYIERENDRYKAFIFFNYLFYPNYFGLHKVTGKSILIPLAYDKPMLYLSDFGKMFSLPGFIMYSTESEKRLVESAHLATRTIRSDITGVGFDCPVLEENTPSPIAFPYFVYIGRIDISKGCLELMDYFFRMNKLQCNGTKLVMIGKNHMDNPVECNSIIFTGFIDKTQKLTYLQHCQAVIVPSRNESLSMVTLEAMSAGKPVLVNGHCEVLRYHIEQSQAGFIYYEREDFSQQINRILNLSSSERQLIAQNGKSYVERNYQWKGVMEKFETAIDYVGTAGVY